MEKLCEYNFGCEDYARDGTWKSWGYNVENNAPAKHRVVFLQKEDGQTFEYDVCDGCNCSLDFDDDDDHKTISSVRIAPPTESYEGKRGKTNHSRVYQLWTQQEKEAALEANRERARANGSLVGNTWQKIVVGLQHP
jgi:hypothetical protein